MIMGFIDKMRALGPAVESTCRVLTEHGCRVAARTYRAWKTRPTPADRTVRDAVIIDALLGTSGTPEGLYGRRKMTHHLRRSGHPGPVLHHRPADDRAGDERGVSRQRRADHDPGQGRTPGRGPAQPGLHRHGPQHRLDRGLHVLPDVGGVRLRRLRRRRVRPADRGLARRHRQEDQPGPDPGADRSVGTRPSKVIRSPQGTCCITATQAVKPDSTGGRNTVCM